MNHVIPISGKAILATALVQTAYRPEINYQYLFCDVGTELPETYEWLSEVEKKTGWSITRVGANLEAKIHSYNGFLPSVNARYCTTESKIQPMEALYQSETTVYYGLRADETQRIGYRGSKYITPSYPLVTLGIDLQGVYAILNAQKLMPPSFHWSRLYERVKEKMQGWGDWESRLSQIERNILFAGRSRSNCYFCFFQRRYEWVWLYETHPELFAKSEAFETKADGKSYTWINDYPLSKFQDPAIRERIFNDRVNQVCELIQKKYQGNLFGDSGDTEIAFYSCGLLCGK